MFTYLEIEIPCLQALSDADFLPKSIFDYLKLVYESIDQLRLCSEANASDSVKYPSLVLVGGINYSESIANLDDYFKNASAFCDTAAVDIVRRGKPIIPIKMRAENGTAATQAKILVLRQFVSRFISEEDDPEIKTIYDGNRFTDVDELIKAINTTILTKKDHCEMRYDKILSALETLRHGGPWPFEQDAKLLERIFNDEQFANKFADAVEYFYGTLYFCLNFKSEGLLTKTQVAERLSLLEEENIENVDRLENIIEYASLNPNLAMVAELEISDWMREEHASNTLSVYDYLDDVRVVFNVSHPQFCETFLMFYELLRSVEDVSDYIYAGKLCDSDRRFTSIEEFSQLIDETLHNAKSPIDFDEDLEGD